MHLTIGIIHFNNPQLLEQQLNALACTGSHEVIVVDNASSNSLASLQKQFPHVHFILNTLNRGFAGAANQILSTARGKWILFLNPDAHLRREKVEELIEYAQTHDLDACSPHHLSANYRKPLASFWSLVVEFSPLARIIPLSMFPQPTLVGGCLLIKKQVLREIGGWDERFFLWFEDTDLTKKLLLQKYCIGICSTITIDHEGAADLQKLPIAQARSLFFTSLYAYAEKYFAWWQVLFLDILIKRFSTHKLLPADHRIEASIVVPNVRYTLLSTFLHQNYHFFDFAKQEVIVVTSAERLQQLQHDFPQIIFIKQSKRYGFAHNVNTGFQRARGRFLGTVNDDTILSAQWIEKLLILTDEKTGSLSPCICTPQGTIESCGIEVLPIGKAVPLKEPRLRVATDAFNGACVLLQRAVLDRIGLFDEMFGSYLEDIDLGLRLKNHGFENISTNTVKITHLGQQTSHQITPHKAWLDMKNWWLVVLKNFGWPHWLQYAPGILVERGRNFSGLLKNL